MSKLKKLLKFLVILSIIYVLGPRWPLPNIDNKALPLLNLGIDKIAHHVQNHEASFSNMKPNNEAEIVWANDSMPTQTDYCFVYLPGFGASKAEGEPIHREIAKRYGMNLYLARLEKQGLIEKEPFLDLTVENLVQSAKEAVQIGKVLGKKVIILSCSTGGTLGFYLAANDPQIASIVSYSPNIDLADPTSNLLTGPWGLHLARLFLWSYYRGFEADEEVKKHWTNHYRIEAVVTLKSMLENCMTDEIFKSIHQPVYMSYYYKNETENDDLISIDRMKAVFELMPTPSDKKKLAILPNVSGHCMASQYFSNAAQLDVVRKESFAFIENVLGLSPAS